jgi:hypothetical protein
MACKMRLRSVDFEGGFLLDLNRGCFLQRFDDRTSGEEC